MSPNDQTVFLPTLLEKASDEAALFERDKKGYGQQKSLPNNKTPRYCKM